MADIFISYSKEDQDQARLLAAFLEAAGYSVWWDSDLVSGEQFRKVIMTELGRSRAAIVIWSEHSVQSDWVQSEAGRAHADRKLVPVKAKGLSYRDIPPPFDNMHVENVEEREKILAALVALLARPEISAPAWTRLFKMARFELLSWFGLIGGILSLATNLQSALRLATWARYLFQSWTALLADFWRYLLFFLPEVSKSDAMVFTLMSFAAMNLLLCARKKDRLTPSDRVTIGRSIALTGWALAAFAVFVAGNPGLNAGMYTSFLLTNGLELTIPAVVKFEAFLHYSVLPKIGIGGSRLDHLIDAVLWTYLFLISVVPIVLAYFMISRIFSIRLSVRALSYRLSRIVVGVICIVALNYLGVWLEPETQPAKLSSLGSAHLRLTMT
jgi:hypothetical protein